MNETGQPYAYTGDDPVNAIDPNGLDCGLFSFACAAYDASAGGVKTAAVDTGHFASDPSRWRAEASTWAGVGNFFVNFVQPNPGLGLPHANVANPYPCSDPGYYTFGNYLGAGLFTAGTAGTAFASGPEAAVDIEAANFAQTTAREAFDEDGNLAGHTISGVAQSLKTGALTPSDLPVQVIVREGNSLILNTRSALALEEAGIPRSEWIVENATGDSAAEARLSGQLANNGLGSEGTSSVRITGRG